MGTHPIFESDFDCLTEFKMSNSPPPGSKRHLEQDFTIEPKKMRTITENPSAKKTRGRVKIDIEFMKDKQKRCTTFSKRKNGLMKKSHELATLTGSQVMVLVASGTGHVYTFATPKFKPLINSSSGRRLIQTCLDNDMQLQTPTQEDPNRFEEDVDVEAIESQPKHFQHAQPFHLQQSIGDIQ